MALHHTGHTLWTAHTPTPSADGTRVYVVCGCGRPRVVWDDEWQAELERRAVAEAARQAHEARVQALASRAPVLPLQQSASSAENPDAAPPPPGG